MPKHKLNSLEDLGDFVFSTDPGMEYYAGDEEETPPPARQYLEAHFSRKGRGGKTVTLIRGFKGSPEALKELAKMLKTRCGTGGAVKENEIIIQGNTRNKVMEILTNEGYNVKRVGG